MEANSNQENVFIEWHVHNGRTLEYQTSTDTGTSSFEFTLDPEGDYVSNKLAVICRLVSTFTIYRYLTGWTDIKVTLDETEWKIDIAQTSPVWEGNYFVENNSDLLFLQDNGYEEITGSLKVDSDTLTQIDALSCIKQVGGSINISSNPLLKNIDGMSGITTADYMYVQANPLLENLDGLSHLTSIDTNITIYKNDTLNSIEGLNNLTSISNLLKIQENKCLESLEGLNSLSSVGQLYIKDNVKQDGSITSLLIES